MIDRQKLQAKALVARLHAAADRAEGNLQEVLQDAAVLLDEYQAGLALAMPHPLTGYALCRVMPNAAAPSPTAEREEIVP